METNTIIRTEDSINMGGSFLNETQVRIILGSLGSGDADIKAELPPYNVHLTILTHLLEFRIARSITLVLSLQPIYCLSPGAQSVPVSALLLHLPSV